MIRILYNWKLLKAIKLAAGRSPKTDGLRAIRRFEKSNGFEFDPDNNLHVESVRNCGEIENFIRKSKWVLNAGLKQNAYE